jgi:hypothetical protein
VNSHSHSRSIPFHLENYSKSDFLKIKSLVKYTMSSFLRSVDRDVGYFVMSAATVLDGSDHGLYDLSAAATYNNDGSVSTRARFQMNDIFKDNMFGDAATANSVTFKDLGKTEYGAEVYDVDGVRQGTSTDYVDMRKVQYVSANGNASRAYYVPLGTNLRDPDPAKYVSAIKPSVALVGKLL